MNADTKTKGRWWRPALLGGVLLMALGVAFPAQAAILDLRVLVISTGTADTADPNYDAGLDLLDDMLDTIGVPYDVLDASRDTLTPGMLSNGTNGFYNGIIVTDAELANANGFNFTLEEWQALHAYERDFGVREAVMSGWPINWVAGQDLDYGMDTGAAVGAGSNAVPIQATWVAPAGGGELFEYVNTANPLPVTEWSVIVPPRNDGTGPTVTPLLVNNGDSNQVLISKLTYPDGREVLLSTINNGWWAIHSQVLAYEFLDFATHGVFQGARQVYLAAHVDDIFDGSPLWDKDANVTDESVVVRITPDDVRNAVTEQQVLVNTYPTLANFALDFAFNGIGADKENDPLTKRIVEDKERFRFINHTWSHMDMDVSAGTTYDMARQEIRRNQRVWDDLSLPDYKRNRRVLISGGHSGVFDDMGTELDLTDDIPYPYGINPQFMQAAQDRGVRFLASDPSRPNQGTESYVPGYNILLLPRWPTSVFYNTPDPATLVDEYNYIFYERYWNDGINPCYVPAAICAPRDYAGILAAEADTTLRHLLSYKAWPHYFHQANLRRYNSAGDTLQFDWLHTVLARYEQLITLPIVNVPYYEIGRISKNRVDAQSANVLAQWNTDTGQVTITADRSARVMFTGLSGGAVYGGERIREVRIKDEPRTYAVDQMLTATPTTTTQGGGDGGGTLGGDD